MDAYIIVGDANSFKSSTVRSLTGCRVRGLRDLVQSNVVMKTYVRLSSLQEGGSPIDPHDFVREVQKSGAQSVIFPLRAMSHRKRLDANAYISECIKAGWNIKGIAILDSPNFQLTAAPPGNRVFKYAGGGVPLYYANHIAAQVRRDFGWL